MSRLFFSAGESSGDLHGAGLIQALRDADPSIVCEGIGGRRMAEAGMTLHYDLAKRAVMGFTEVVRAFPEIRRVFLDTTARLEANPPDAVVLIDYPGFNLRLARRVKDMEIPVVYYISPQIWAWKRGRIRTIAEVVRKMLVILPFEESLYREAGVDCRYVGHPLLDRIAAFASSGRISGPCVVGLLPGSREQEIRRLLPVMIETAEGLRASHPEAHFVVPCVDETREAQVRAIAGGFPLETMVGDTYEVLAASRFCMVASGTATLETALFGIPMVIVYKTTAITHWLARRLIHVRYIGLVNLLADRAIVPEFIQDDATAERLLPVVRELIDDTSRRRTMVEELAWTCGTLGGPGAAARAASSILEVLRAEPGGTAHE